ncbi:MAG: 50S ribosomal protein L18e [Candidatus Aenigmarchaeota archaeon]|nr:50S ribosomal protein L18e [Candidatus Aenigmarchaeota archaeon]
MPKPTGPMNPLVIEIASGIRKKYPDVARHLTRPRRKKPGVNMNKISRSSQDNDVVIVPGACLGEGSMERKVTVYAMKFSSSARKKIEAKGGKCLPLSQLMKDGAKGRILI